MRGSGDTAHVWRMAVVLILLGTVGLCVRWMLVPADFGRLGHYRAGNLTEILAQQPVHVGRATCGECHVDVYEVHGKDIHFGVQCEDCHGAGNLHVRYHTESDAGLSAEHATLPKEYTLEGCLFCHRRLAARPRNFPQVDPAEHYAFLHVTDPTTRCIECHSPHEPLFLLTAVRDARIHPVIHECEYCHDARPQRSHTEVAEHPAIFVCRDCHPAVAADFEKREHAFMRCTACHLFHQENETAGRIFKNGNRRFCLLCHEQEPFKEEGLPPQVVSAEHVAEMAAMMDLDAGRLAEDPRACLECHFDYIHDRELIERGGVLSHE